LKGRAPREGHTVVAAIDGSDDGDETYVGDSPFSNFFTDGGEQIKGVAIFCGVLGSFFLGGNVLAGLLLPWLFGDGDTTNLGTFQYWAGF